MQKISTIIITYNNEKEIKNCINSILKKSPETQIIIVDNNSEDKTIDNIKFIINKNNIELIESAENLGYGKANNLGVKNALGEYLIFLNPDTVILEEHFFVKLATTLSQNPDYGIIGPKIMNLDHKVQKSVRKLPTVIGAFQEYILGQKGAYDFYEIKDKQFSEVESVVGACIIIKKEIFNKIGGFNEKYFMYFEDLELCKIVRKLGLKIGYLPNIQIQHQTGASGFGKPTSAFAKDSAKKYHGLINYYLIELILTFQRIVNKIKNIF